MRTRINELELTLNEKTSKYEKDKILLEEKIKFIEQERNMLKKENSEGKKIFENMLNSIEEKNRLEKLNNENDKNMIISDLENKYKKQIDDLNNNHDKKYNELYEHCKEIENELNDVKLENENNKKKKNQNIELAQKIEEINAENEKYRKNEDVLKQLQDKKIVEINSDFELEKQNYKKKNR